MNNCALETCTLPNCTRCTPKENITAPLLFAIKLVFFAIAIGFLSVLDLLIGNDPLIEAV